MRSAITNYRHDTRGGAGFSVGRARSEKRIEKNEEREKDSPRVEKTRSSLFYNPPELAGIPLFRVRIVNS